MSVSVKKVSDGTLFNFNCAQWSLMSPANQAEWEVLENTCGLVTLLFNPYAASEFFYTLDGRVAADDPLQIVTLDGISTINFKDQAAATVLAGPVSGADDYPTFRALELSDLPFPAGTAQGQIMRWNHTTKEWEIYSGTTGGNVLEWDTTNGWQEGTPSGGVSDGDKGDITVSSGGAVWTIDDDVVTDSKLRNSAALSVIGNSTNATANPADIVAAGDGDVLRRSGTSLAFGKVATAGIEDNAVTNPKLRDSAALSVIGRSANSAGDPADISAGTDGHVLRRSGTTLGFGTVATDGIADDAVTYAKIQNVVNNNRILGRVSGANGVIEELTAAQVQTLLSFLDGALTTPRIPYASDANTLTDSASLRWLNGTLEVIVGDGTTKDARFTHAQAGNIAGGSKAFWGENNVSGDYRIGLVNTRNLANTGNAYLQIQVGGANAGDPFIYLGAIGAGFWVLGMDNSDADKFKLKPNANNPGNVANSGITITAEAVAKIGINKDAPQHPLDVEGVTRAVQFRGTGNLWDDGNITFHAGAGTGPVINSISGTNNAFQINFTTGTAPTAGADIFTATYPQPFGVLSYPVFSQRANTNLSGVMNSLTCRSATANNLILDIEAGVSLPASTQCSLTFVIMGY